MEAIILAGGKGTRLKPYTVTLPKPLVPVGEKPILEIIVNQLNKQGFKKITLAVGHLSELIEAYFGNGKKFGVEIKYSREEKPLGTAGPLKLIQNTDTHFLVMNSDDLTDFDYKKFLEVHKNSDAAITIATYKKEVKIDLGVLKIDSQNELQDYIEKPTYHHNVSMGIYAFSKEALNFIPEGEYFDFPSLIKKIKLAGKSVKCYQHTGYWLDIGRPEDFEKANEDFVKIHKKES